MKYQRRPEIVDAIRWWKHGDHPAVEVHTNPFHNRVMGIFKDEFVYPGNWVVTHPNGHIEILMDRMFEMRYEEV